MGAAISKTKDDKRAPLRAEQIRLEAGVAVFVGPQGEWDSGQVVNERDRVAIFGQVDRAEEEFASIAGFDPNMGKLFGDVDGKLVFGFLAARGAQDAAKIPFAETKGANEAALAAVAFGPEYAKKWSRTAKGTDA